MSLKMKEIMPPEHKMPWTNASISVTAETHAKIKEVSRKTGYSIKETADILMNYALDNIEWEEKR